MKLFAIYPKIITTFVSLTIKTIKIMKPKTIISIVVGTLLLVFTYIITCCGVYITKDEITEKNKYQFYTGKPKSMNFVTHDSDFKKNIDNYENELQGYAAYRTAVGYINYKTIVRW